MKKHLLILAALATAFAATAQEYPENNDDRTPCYQTPARRIISIPDIDGYRTLKGDFHMHTVYADAQVAPKGRVQEAWYDGLDVIAMTEHIGVHKSPGIHLEDQNLPFNLAKEEGEKWGVTVIHGAEITRAKPFGHMNALFVNDCSVFSMDRYIKDADGHNLIDPETGRSINNLETLEQDIEAALAQGAFILWNHPGWPDKVCEMFPIHEKMLAQGRIHGVELCNSHEWYPKVLDWFDERHIPMFANSDTHRPTSVEYGEEIRPITLVFAKDASEEAIKEAMFAGRVAAFWEQKLAGDAKYLEQLVHHSLIVKVLDAKKGRIEVTNISDIRFEGVYSDKKNPIVFPARRSIIISCKKGDNVEFLNCFTGRAHLKTPLW